MKLIVNDEAFEAKARTLEGLLVELGYEGDWYATAINSQFVPGPERVQTPLSDGDRIEILTPMQGG